MGAKQGVAHEVDKAQTQAPESRYGAGKRNTRGHSAQRPFPSPSDLQLRRGVSRRVVIRPGRDGELSVQSPHSCQGETALCGWLGGGVAAEPRKSRERQGGKGVLRISRPRGRSPATWGLKGQRGGQESDRCAICSFRPWLNRCSNTGRATSQERGFSGNFNFLL